MICLIPMAGRGNRFYQELYQVPKPFIPIMGSPMFIMALKSFPKADKYIFICREEYYDKYKLKKIVDKTFNQSKVVLLDRITEGQACTCLMAENEWESQEGLFIASCDYQTIYNREKYKKLLKDPEVEVIIWTFKLGNVTKARPEEFAYCRTEGDRVAEVVEKRTISDNPRSDQAVAGSITYKRAELFVRGAKQMIRKNIRINNEFYVGTSLNQLIDEGVKVVAFEIDKFISFGNPFELKAFQFWQDYFDRLEDHHYSIGSLPYPFLSRSQ